MNLPYIYLSKRTRELKILGELVQNLCVLTAVHQDKKSKEWRAEVWRFCCSMT